MPAIWRFVLTMRLCLFFFGLPFGEIWWRTDYDTDITSVRRLWRLITLASIIWMSWSRVWCAALARAWGFLDSWTGWWILSRPMSAVIYDTLHDEIPCSDLRKLGMNLIPFPRVSPLFVVFIFEPSSCMTLYQKKLHFLMPSYAPFVDARSKKYENVSIPDLTRAYVVPFKRWFFKCQGSDKVFRLFDRKNLLVACDPRFGFVPFPFRRIFFFLEFLFFQADT